MRQVLSAAATFYPFQWFDNFSAFIIFALLGLIFLLSLSDPALQPDTMTSAAPSEARTRLRS